MSRWKKYQKSKNSLSSADRYRKQLEHALDIWITKPGNSLIQIAKMVREYGKLTGREVEFDESIAIARRLSNGICK
jgi:hypothetical protein